MMTEQAEPIYHECLIDDTSGGDWLKYWEAKVVGCELFFREGSLKNQHTNKWKSKTYASPKAAVAGAKKRRFNKIKKHYREGTFDEHGSAIPAWPEFFKGFVDEIQCLLDGDLKPDVLRCKLEYVYNTVYARYPSRTEAKLDDYLREQLKTKLPVSELRCDVRLFEYVSHPKNEWRKALAVVSPEGKKKYPFARFTRKFEFEFDGNHLFQDVEQFDEAVPTHLIRKPIDVSAWRKNGVFEHIEVLDISYTNLSEPWQTEGVALDANDLKGLLEAGRSLKYLRLRLSGLHHDALKVFREEGVCTLDTLGFYSRFGLSEACELNFAARQNIHTLVLSPTWHPLYEVTSVFTKKSDFFDGLKRVEIHNYREKSLPKELGEKFAVLPSLSQVETIALSAVSRDFMAGWCTPDATTRPKEFVLSSFNPPLNFLKYLVSLEHWPFEKLIFELSYNPSTDDVNYAENFSFIEASGAPIELKAYHVWNQD